MGLSLERVQVQQTIVKGYHVQVELFVTANLRLLEQGLIDLTSKRRPALCRNCIPAILDNLLFSLLLTTGLEGLAVVKVEEFAGADHHSPPDQRPGNLIRGSARRFALSLGLLAFDNRRSQCPVFNVRPLGDELTVRRYRKRFYPCNVPFLFRYLIFSNGRYVLRGIVIKHHRVELHWVKDHRRN